VWLLSISGPWKFYSLFKTHLITEHPHVFVSTSHVVHGFSSAHHAEFSISGTFASSSVSKHGDYLPTTASNVYKSIPPADTENGSVSQEEPVTAKSRSGISINYNVEKFIAQTVVTTRLAIMMLIALTMINLKGHWGDSLSIQTTSWITDWAVVQNGGLMLL
jgi:hypothetical protein